MPVADIERFKEVLGQTKQALIILPQNPNFDSVAAGLSLSLALRKRGLTATVSCPSQMTVEFNRLVAVNKVRQDLGDKNLVLSFANYPAEDIERVSYNIENGQFTLTVIPKPGNSAPRQEQINSSYAGISSDLVIVVNANYPSGLGRFAENKELLESKNLTLFSNDPLSGWPRSIELIDTSCSSVSEVAYEVIEQLGIEIDQDLATNLYMGLEAGTVSFSSGQVSADTFEKAARLLRAGAQRASQQRSVQEGSSQVRQAPQDWTGPPKVYKGSTLP